MSDLPSPADAWLPDQILYQIFPDRFFVGQGRMVDEKIAAGLYGDGATARGWDELPAVPPHVNTREFFGGDLWGVAEKLDYLQDLGVTGLYLNPIFTAPSNHKYDTVDYEAVDPAFGGNAAFDALAREAERCGMALILDGVFNHVGQAHPWNTDESFRDFFLRMDGERQYWWGHQSLPELDLSNPAVREYFLGQEGVVRRWLRRGARAWRLDTGQDLGRGFVRAVRDAARAERPDTPVFPELFCFGNDWVRDDNKGAGADGVMNYYIRDAILDYIRGDIPARLAGVAFEDVYTRFGHAAALRSWNMLGSHDVDRTRTVVADAEAVPLAVTLQFTLPGIPLIYYGEENGMEGGADPANRAPMIWDERRWHPGIRGRTRALIALRRERRELRRGRFVGLTSRLEPSGANVIAFFRATETPGEFSLVLVNRDNVRRTVTFFVPYAHLYGGLQLVDVLGGAPPLDASARLTVTLAPQSASLYVPRETRLPRYHFYKGR